MVQININKTKLLELLTDSFIVDAAPRVQKESGSKKELHYTEVVETEMVPQRSPPCTLHGKDKQRE